MTQKTRYRHLLKVIIVPVLFVLFFLITTPQIFAADEQLIKTITIKYPSKTVGKTSGVAVAGAKYTFTVSGAPSGSKYKWATSATGGKWTGSGASRTFSPLGTSRTTKYHFKVRVYPPGDGGEGKPWMTEGSEILGNPIVKFSTPTKDQYVAKGNSEPVDVVVKVTHGAKTLSGVKVEFRENGKAIGSFNPTSASTSIGIAASEFAVKATAKAGDSTTLQAKCGATIENGKKVTVVEVGKIQYKISGKSYKDMPNPLAVSLGTTVSFKAITNPKNSLWPTGKPVWGGEASGTGETTSATFNTISANSTDYKTVTAECGNTITANVLVTSAKVSYVEAVDSNNAKRKSQTKLQMVCLSGGVRNATVTAYKNNLKLDWAEDEPVWTGLISKIGTDSVTVSTSKSGTESAKTGDITKTVTIEIMGQEPGKASISFDAFEAVVNRIQSAIGGGTVSNSLTGNAKWYNVDQKSSPLIQKNVELSAGGQLGLSQKFYIPSLSFDFRFISGGAFVIPAVNISAKVNAERDGTQNPVKWTGGGGAELEGSITAGGDVFITVPWEIITATAGGSGKASAKGKFKYTAPPKLSGSYNLGKLTAHAWLKVKYRDGEIINETYDKELWGGISGSATVNLFTE